MKKIIFVLVLSAVIIAACNSKGNKSDATISGNRDTVQTVSKNDDAAKSHSINEVVADYLQLKNALANDNGSAAADAGKKLENTIAEFDKSSLTGEQMSVLSDTQDDIKEHAEHISANGDKIEHQREHFEMLSKDIYDLVKAVRAKQALYMDYCPMYNNNKGAMWLSENKEIVNPYLGKEMSTCGQVKEEIN